MSGFVRLKLGDLFEGPSDLIVLPCSTSGTVTRFVSVRLQQYSIPLPRSRMRSGDVDFKEFTGAENIAQYVAFACSVNGMNSDFSAIESIGRLLGKFSCENEAIREIAAPLLGSGAGGLAPEDCLSALTKGFNETAHEKATLTIHVLSKIDYSKLTSIATNGVRRKLHTEHRPVRVFISYSGTSKQHGEWVASISTYLRQNGINARLDQWHLRKGMDLPQWMANELEMAERVIIISDARYADRADGRSGGVGWETMLIQGDMLGLAADSTKYIAVVKEDIFDSGIPRYLKTKYCIHWTSDSDEEKLKKDLLAELYNIPLEPPIGLPPVYNL